MEDLLDTEILLGILGYKDPRSLSRWCKSRSIPILKMGAKKYINKHLLTQVIDNQLFTFGVIKKVTDLITRVNVKNQSSSTPVENAKPIVADNGHSQIANDFLDKLKLKHK